MCGAPSYGQPGSRASPREGNGRYRMAGTRTAVMLRTLLNRRLNHRSGYPPSLSSLNRTSCIDRRVSRGTFPDNLSNLGGCPQAILYAKPRCFASSASGKHHYKEKSGERVLPPSVTVAWSRRPGCPHDSIDIESPLRREICEQGVNCICIAADGLLLMLRGESDETPVTEEISGDTRNCRGIAPGNLSCHNHFHG